MGSSSSSWACSACTFLNPSSKSLFCTICNTPNNTTSTDKNVPKWECRACTYLNTYSLSSCELCSTRAPSSTPLSILHAHDYDAGPDVGQVFFPLRKCSTSAGIDNGGFELKERVKKKMGIDHFVNLCVALSSNKNNNTKKDKERKEEDFDGADDIDMGTENAAIKKDDFEEAARCSWSVETAVKSQSSSALKRKRDQSDTDVKSDQFDGFRDVKSFRDWVVDSDAADDFSGLPKKELHEDLRNSGSAEIPDNKKGSIAFKRKWDLGDFDEEPIEVSGFRDIKSHKKKPLSISENAKAISGDAMDEKVCNPRVGLSSVSVEIAGNDNVKKTSVTIKILSYNVWFREDLEVIERMRAIGDLIQLHSPDVICFQEVTPNIFAILQASLWWGKYRSSVTKGMTEQYFCMQLVKLPISVQSFISNPFSNSIMGRELCVAHIGVDMNKALVVATSHLESVCLSPPTWDQTFTKERVEQAKEAIRHLDQYPNVIFCGDMNWDEKLDGQFPITEGWFDAWQKLRPSEVGWTHDTKSNKMLTGNRLLQKRLDRFVCRLPDFDVSSIDMIGTEAIPGLTYMKTKKLKNKTQELALPILPSDHYGLLLTMTSK